ncbi:MAG: hypothetical protein IJT70_00450 [Clostridia bacterium]|nr:hypothetical protein [Clostridia bacterium]
MITVLCIAVCAAALISALVFGSSAVLCIIVALAAAALWVLRRFIFKNSKIMNAAVPVIGIALLVVCLFIPTRATDYGFDDYSKTYSDYFDAMTDEDDEEAEEIRGKIAEKYGETDAVRYLEALRALHKGDVEGANEILRSFENIRTINYYSLRELLIGAQAEKDEDITGRLRSLYEEALGYNPEWVYALKNLGIIYFDDNKYEKADYYLTKAYVCDGGEDGEIAYYLGASMYEQGRIDQAFEMFEAAADAGVNDEIGGYIAWYCSQALMEGDE